MSERQFWFSYSKPDGLWDMEIKGTMKRVIELRVGLEVNHTQTPIELSSGKYRNTPFVTGISTTASNELQFVLLKKSDGTIEGSIIDELGIRKLIST